MAGYTTGENGAINGVPCLRRYRVISTASPATGVCSASGGGQFAMPGNTDFRAVAVAYGVEPPATAQPGEEFTFTAFDGGVGFTSTNAYVDKVRMFWNVEDADMLYYELYFSGNGVLTADDSAVDATTASPVSAMGMGATIDDEAFDIRRAMLEISCPGVPFVDSASTSGITEREKGNYTASFEIEAYTKADLPTKNALVSFTIDALVADDDAWDLDYMLITEAASEMVKGDQQGRGVGNACKLKGIWSAYSDDEQGHILTPADSYIFGS